MLEYELNADGTTRLAQTHVCRRFPNGVHHKVYVERKLANRDLRRLTHLVSAKDELYFSFLEWEGDTAIGGGIGLADWNEGGQPLWEASYTELMRERVAKSGADTLDLILFQGAPVVVLNAVGALLTLDTKSRTFSAIDIAGTTGAKPSHDGKTLLTSSTLGFQALSKEHRFEKVAVNPAADLVPSSHLFRGRTA